MAECDDRARRRSERRIKAAGVPPREIPARLRLRRQPERRPRRRQHPRHLRLGQEGLPLCLIGDSGTGTSHLLIALGTEAAMAGTASATPRPPSSSTSSSRPPTTSS
ncbi:MULTISPECIES: ATP-binding protein [unclassified Nonomuraea]|uniref:ATP-binding protein n=1 Tax=unclassified Nonomuraea TaxID=2593643 RepID=UPI00339B85C0